MKSNKLKVPSPIEMHQNRHYLDGQVASVRQYNGHFSMVERPWNIITPKSVLGNTPVDCLHPVYKNRNWDEFEVMIVPADCSFTKIEKVLSFRGNKQDLAEHAIKNMAFFSKAEISAIAKDKDATIPILIPFVVRESKVNHLYMIRLQDNGTLRQVSHCRSDHRQGFGGGLLILPSHLG